jgi:PAS domain S-box-containing protein
MSGHASEFESTVGNRTAIVVLDLSGRVTFVDPMVEQITGYPAERFTSQDPFDLVHPEDRDSVMRLLECCMMALDVELEGRFRLVRSDGECRWFEVQCRNLANDPAIGGVMVQMDDITDRLLKR